MSCFFDVGELDGGGFWVIDAYASDQNNFQDHSVTYGAVGSHEILVWCSNERSYIMLNVTAEVDKAIVGEVTAADTILSTSSITKFATSITAGTRIQFSFDLGNDDTKELLYVTHTDVLSEIDYAYSAMGMYTVLLNVTNSLTTKQYEFTVRVGLPITSNTWTNSGHTILGQNFTGSLTLSNSSMVTCTFTYGDDTYEVIYNLFTDSAIEIEKEYSAVAVYDYSYICENIFGNVTGSGTVAVQEPLEGLSTTNPACCVKTGEDYSLSWTLTKGTNVTFITEVDESAAGTVTYNFNDMTGSAVIASGDYGSYGTKSVLLKGTNHISSENETIVIEADNEITGASIDSPAYVTPGSNSLPMSVTAGSRKGWYLDPGDGNPTEVQTDTGVETTSTFTYTYEAGYFIQSLTVNNSISSLTVTKSIGIENPLSDQSTLTWVNVSDPATAVDFTLTHGGGADPDSVVTDMNYGDSGTNVTSDVTLTSATQHTEQHTYTTAGLYTAHFTVRNNVSEIKRTAYVKVGSDVTNLDLSADVRAAAKDASVTLTASVDAGSDISYAIDCGNGQTETKSRTTPGHTVADSTTFACVYANPGTYSISVTATNPFGSTTANLPHTVLVQNVLSDLTVVPDNAFVASSSGNVAFTVSSTSIPSGPLSCNWTYADASVETTDAVQLASGASFVHSHTDTTAGNKTISVTCGNEVSSQTQSVDVAIQDEVTSISLACPPARVGQPSVIELTTVGGTDLSEFVSYGDNEEATMDVSPTVSHTYANRGNYTATVRAFNGVSSQQDTVECVVQKPIPSGITLTNSDYSKYGEPAQLTLVFPEQRDSIFLDFSYGNGENGMVYVGAVDSALTVENSHTYNAVGPSSISVNISNMVSHEVVTGSITIEKEITDVTLDVNPKSTQDALLPAVMPSGQVTISASAGTGTDPVFTMLVDDAEECSQSKTGDGGDHTCTYIPATTGNKTVAVQVSNHVSSVPLNQTLVVVNPLNEADMDIKLRAVGSVVEDKTLLADGSGAELDVHCQIIETKPIPGLVTVTVDYTDPNQPDETRFISAFPSVSHIQAPKVLGQGGLTLKFTNPISDFNIVKTYEVLEKVEILEAIIPKAIPFGFLLEFSWSLKTGTGSGGQITSTVDFGDGAEKVVKAATYKPGDVAVNDEYKYLSPGVFTLVLNISNALSYDELTQEIAVIADLPVMVIEKLSTIKYEGSPVIANILIKITDRLPIDVNVRIDRGVENDAPVDIQKSLSDDIQLEIKYETTGFYPLKLNVSTSYNYTLATEVISVQSELTDLTFKITEKAEEEQTSSTTGEKEVFVGVSLLFTPSHGGTGANYTWTITKDGQTDADNTETTNATTWSAVMPYTGRYIVQLSATNGLADPLIHQRILIVKPNGRIKSFLYSGSINVGQIEAFNLTLVGKIPDACIKLVLDNIFWMATAEALCAEHDDFRSDNFKIVTPVVDESGSDVYVMEHSFLVENKYTVLAIVYDGQGTKSESQGAISVTRYCRSPRIDLLNEEYSSVKKRVVSRRSEELMIEQLTYFNLDIDCQTTEQPKLQWPVYKVVNKTSGFVNPAVVDVTSQSQILAEGFRIHSGALEYGFYYVEFNLTLNGLSDKNGVYLEILKSPVVTSFNKAFRTLGSNVEEVIDITANTRDPDVDSNEGFTYTWLCHQKDDNMEGTNFEKANLDSFTSIDIPTDDSGMTSNQGGCFGTGSGRLNVEGGQISFNTGNVIHDVMLVLVVVVAKDDRKASAQQLIQVQNGQPPELEIRCLENCRTKLNTQQASMFEVVVKNADIGIPTTEWTVTGKYQTGAAPTFSTDDFSGGTQRLTIAANALDESDEYEIEVIVTPGAGTGLAQGRDFFIFYTSAKPFGGTCSVDPVEGESLQDFTLSCRDWKDDGDEKPTSATTPVSPTVLPSVTYAYRISDKHNIEKISPKAQLPTGDETNGYKLKLIFTLVDDYETKTETSLFVVVKKNSDPNAAKNALAKMTSQQGTLTLNVAASLTMMAAISSELTVSAAVTDGSSGTSGGSGTSDSSGSSSGTSGTTGSTTGVSTANALEQQRKKEMQSQLAVMLSMAVSMNSPDSTIKLSASQQKDVSLTVASMASKFDDQTSDSAMEDVFSFATSLEAALTSGDMSPVQTKELAKSVMEATGSAAKTLDPKPKVVLTAEEELAKIIDEPMTVEQEEKLKAAEAAEKAAAERMAKIAAQSTVTSQEMLGLSLSKGAPDNVQTDIKTPTIQLAVVASKKSSDMNNKNVSLDGMKLELADVTSHMSLDEAQRDTGVQVSSVKVNPFTYDTSAGDIANSSVIIANILSYGASRSNSDKVNNVPMKVQQNLASSADIEPPDLQNMTVDTDTGMSYTTMKVEIPFSALQMDVRPDDDTVESIDAYSIINCTDIILCRPNKTHHEYKMQVNASINWRLSIPAKMVTGDIYLAFDFKRKAVGGRQKREATTETNTTVPRLDIKAGFARCRAWDKKQEKWRSDLCEVDDSSELGTVGCNCKTSPDVEAFSSGFTPPTVNTIDFNKIFSQFDKLLAENPAVFATMFVILGVYFMLAVWARRADKKDVEKWGVLPLADNNPSHTNFYKVSVFTGMRRGAGTKSDICFIMTGDGADSGVRKLEDKKKRAFSTSSIRHFVLSTEASLGSLTFMRIWHDNSGKGDYASWYLDKILVEDLQTKERYFFLCDQWMAIDEEDGMIDRILPVAGRDEVTGFNHLFFNNARKKLFDDHLWVSLVGRPNRSNFTRLQRLTCILMLLYTTMLANAMFYGQGEVDNDKVLHVGPIILSAATIIVSIYGSLAVVPANMIVVTLFRKTRPKDWPADDEVMSADGKTIKVKETEKAQKRKKWWKKKYPLPYWCAYIAWAFALSCILTSGAFVIFFNLTWDKKKSEEWLSSLFLSTIQSVLIVQPLKVLFLAMVIALIFKTLDDDDDEEEDKKGNAKANPDEELTDENLITLKTLTAVQPPEPLNPTELAEAREKRNLEKRTWSLVKEALFYFLFLLLISFIVWGSKDPLLHRQNKFLVDEIAGGDLAAMKETVTDGHAFWHWSRYTMVPSLYYMKKYDGRPTTVRDRQYMQDGVSFRVGPLRMRQLRITPGACDVVGTMRKYVPECNKGYNMFEEQDKNFTLNWEYDPITNYTEGELTKAEEAFRYRSFIDLRGMPYWGTMATYGGGGYVADLGTTNVQAEKMLDELLANNWIDYYTRAIFIEFTVYNPNINLFAYVSYLMEFPPTGGILPHPRIMSFKLYHVYDGMEYLILGCEVLYMLLIVIFMVREILKFKRLKSQYWKDPWNYIEVIIIIMSFVALAMYVMRYIIGHIVLDDLTENLDKYTNFVTFAYYDELYWCVIGAIVFMSNLKFLRLLRFNKHITHFAATLALCKKDLLHFGVTFFILFFAFTSTGYLLFGRHMLDFHTVITAMESLYSMLIGKFDFREMEKADRYLGPIYFAVFMVLMFFITINMFLGIIGTAYSQIREEPELAGDDYKVINFLQSRVKKMLGIEEQNNHKEVRYMDEMETLNMRLDSLDRMVTEECRNILGLAVEEQRQQQQQQEPQPQPGRSYSPKDKQHMDKENKSKVGHLAYLTKLQQSSSSEAWS